MGTYSEIHGSITIENKKYKEFKDKYKSFLKKQDWIKFEDLFIEDKVYHEVGSMKLHINPMKNSFKLLGYPDNFEQFFGFLRDNVNLIEYFSIIADVEDASFFIFRYSYHDEDKFILQMFRTDEGIIENESYNNWHRDFKESLKTDNQ